jgi:two-component sensor histidine kinase
LQLVASVLNRQAREAASNQDLSEALAQASQRIHAVAQVHAFLQRGRGQVELAAYLGELCTELQHSCATLGETLIERRLEDIAMPGEPAVALGLVTTELITNALKHGVRRNGSGRVRVSLSSDAGGSLRLAVEDDGPGLPKDFNPACSHGLGMRLVQQLVHSLGGRLELDAGPPGARFTLVLTPGNDAARAARRQAAGEGASCG